LKDGIDMGSGSVNTRRVNASTNDKVTFGLTVPVDTIYNSIWEIGTDGVKPGEEMTVLVSSSNNPFLFDTFLTIYSRKSTDSRSSPSTNYTFVGSDDNSGGSLGSLFKFTVQSNTSYQAVITAARPSQLFQGVEKLGYDGLGYTLEISIDSAGNTPGSAKDLGLLSIGSPKSFSDFVGYGDRADWYKFSVDRPMEFKVGFRNSQTPGEPRIISPTGSIVGIGDGKVNTSISGIGVYSIYVSVDGVAPNNYTIDLSASSIPVKVAESDFNGDGKTDLVWRNYATGQNAIWSMNGTTFSEGTFTTPVSDINWSLASTGDFNGDGKSDLVWRNYVTGENGIWIMNGTTLSRGVPITPIRDLNWSIAATGDFDADGKSDLVWRNYKTGENAIWLMNGTELSRGVYTTPADLNWSIGGAGDFNNDGKSDLVWRNYKTGENAIWLMNGTEFSKGVYTTPASDLNWQMAGTGDFNNDGNSDLIWRNGSSGKNAVWLMKGTTLFDGVFLNDIPDQNWKISNAFAGNPSIFPGRR
jgi:hypothetical protein